MVSHAEMPETGAYRPQPGMIGTRIATIRRTCAACPAQWEGSTEDGKSVYIRFRWGVLAIGVGQTMDEAVMNHRRDPLFCARLSDDLDGSLGYEALRAATSGVVELPPAEAP
jgi:hypothetical protein